MSAALDRDAVEQLAHELLLCVRAPIDARAAAWPRRLTAMQRRMLQLLATRQYIGGYGLITLRSLLARGLARPGKRRGSWRGLERAG